MASSVVISTPCSQMCKAASIQVSNRQWVADSRVFTTGFALSISGPDGGSHGWVTVGRRSRPPGTLEQKGQVERKIGHDWATDKLQINTRTALSIGVQDQGFPDR